MHTSNIQQPWSPSMEDWWYHLHWLGRQRRLLSRGNYYQVEDLGVSALDHVFVSPYVFSLQIVSRISSAFPWVFFPFFLSYFLLLIALLLWGGFCTDLLGHYCRLSVQVRKGDRSTGIVSEWLANHFFVSLLSFSSSWKRVQTEGIMWFWRCDRTWVLITLFPAYQNLVQQMESKTESGNITPFQK